MTEKKRITEDDLNRYLSAEEGPYFDLKHSDIAPAKLTKTISAFCNSAGGEILVGIGEDKAEEKSRYWAGYDDMESTNAVFQVIEDMLPLGNHYESTFLVVDSKPGLLLHLIVFKTPGIVKASDGKAYVRKGAQNLPVESNDALRRLEMEKGVISFEDNAVAVGQQVITNSLSTLSFMLHALPRSEPEEWLKKQNLLIPAGPTVAGVMLFADEPQAILPKRSAIKVYRYQTKGSGSRDSLAFDPLTIEGCIYDLIKAAVNKTKEVVEGISKLGPNGLEKIAYPDDTLHEIITNAVLHRDYSVPADVHVRIFDNRIEVESPGRLPGHITKENILNEQFARNPKIVRLINKFPDPPNKDVGEGLNTAFEAMKKLQLQPPEIEELNNSVVVHIRHTPLASPHDVVMTYLETNSEISNRIVRELTGIGSENVVKQVFLDLQARGLIEKVPGKRGSASAWRTITSPSED
ncbi:ATP-dependent DNA helicase RecG [Pusillimonas caeni]|uniref:ATP-binding protein n=1 Tax=Pusillimonas caeni TaxID=1348472 RepID=UPI000E59CA06|nr:ATP-binding protein [Pusillimonas caeni]TFL14189.1 ATP-dependent DNA helicase RecG [Pusillimonas caeni]